MLSLSQALDNVQVPVVLTNIVESYLDVGSLKNWRLTNKQALQDVDHKVNLLLHSADKLNLIRTPPGPFLGSAWFQFMTEVYQCENCMSYVSPINDNVTYDTQEAEEHQLCGMCFLDLADVSVCDSCSVVTKSFNGDFCTHCETFFCGHCTHEIIAPCDTCQELFCDECLLINTCTHCH